jgi:hypothetical protein
MRELALAHDAVLVRLRRSRSAARRPLRGSASVARRSATRKMAALRSSIRSFALTTASLVGAAVHEHRRAPDAAHLQLPAVERAERELLPRDARVADGQPRRWCSPGRTRIGWMRGAGSSARFVAATDAAGTVDRDELADALGFVERPCEDEARHRRFARTARSSPR